MTVITKERKSLPDIHLRAGGIKRTLYDVLLQFCYITVTKLYWLLTYKLLYLYYEKQTRNPSRNRNQETWSFRFPRGWSVTGRSTVRTLQSRSTWEGPTRWDRWNVRFRRTWTEDLLMYGQDLYFVTVVAIIGFIFLVIAMVLERIFDRWKVLSRQPWQMTKNLLYS